MAFANDDRQRVVALFVVFKQAWRTVARRIALLVAACSLLLFFQLPAALAQAAQDAQQPNATRLRISQVR